MDRIIAYCGLDCSGCEAYQATQANDEAAKERIAIKWRVEHNAPELTAAAITCDGCVTQAGRPGCYGPFCPIRACGVERAVVNCGHCADYATCEKLNGFLAHVPPARANLETVRQNLR